MNGEKPAAKGATKKAPVAKVGAVRAPAPRPRAASGRFTKAGPTKASPTRASAAKRPAPAAKAPAPPVATATKAPEGAVDGPIELYFVRHADAGDPLAWVGDDADRPLSKKGRRQAKRLGRLLDGLGVRVGAVFSSPKLRATETARIVARSVGAGWEPDDRLGTEFGDEALRALVAGLAPGVSSVMLVGHDPDFSRVVSWVVGTSIEMRKGALARVSLPDRNVGTGRGSLRWLLPPDAVAR